MKYFAIITYASGTRTGARVEANSMKEAWEKLQNLLPTDHITSVDLSQVR